MSAPQWVETVLAEHRTLGYDDVDGCECGADVRTSGQHAAHVAAVLWAEFTARAQQTREDVTGAICVSATGESAYHGLWTDEADAAIASLLTAMGGERAHTDEDVHGPWDKESQRYEDGCKAGDTHAARTFGGAQ